MKNKPYLALAVLCGISVLGCTVQDIKYTFSFELSDEEIYKPEAEALAAFEKEKATGAYEIIGQWVQPENKKEQCKIYVASRRNNPPATGTRYYWDGACKNGYAYDIGRTFTRAPTKEYEEIEVYSGNQTKPYGYYSKENQSRFYGIIDNENLEIAGLRMSVLNSDKSDIDIEMNYFVADKEVAYMFVYAVTNFDSAIIKQYPNFSYWLVDSKQNPYSNVRATFGVKDLNKKDFGYNLVRLNNKDNDLITVDTATGERIKESGAYYDRAQVIIEEIKSNIGENAENAKQTAENFIRRYKSKTCSTTPKAPFNSWPEYLDICKEDEYFADVRKRVSNRIARIKQRLAEDKERLAQQQALERAQAAALAASFNQALQQLNQSLSNMNNQTNQMLMSLPAPQLPTVQNFNYSQPKKFIYCRKIGKFVRCN